MTSFTGTVTGVLSEDTAAPFTGEVMVDGRSRNVQGSVLLIPEVRSINLGMTLTAPAAIEAGTIYTFGHVFPKGVVRADEEIVLFSGSTPLLTQTDVLALHKDGSVRHAALALAIPRSMAPSDVLNLSFFVRRQAAREPLNTALFENRSLTASVSLPYSGELTDGEKEVVVVASADLFALNATSDKRPTLSISLDGDALRDVRIAAQRSLGQTEEVRFNVGDASVLTLGYWNDQSLGSDPIKNRNLYIHSVVIDGVQISGALDMRSNGERHVLLPIGEPMRFNVDLLELVRNSEDVWRSGPLVHETRVTIPVPPEFVGGRTSMRLIADVALLADGTLQSDVWLANDVAFDPKGGPMDVSFRVEADGVPVCDYSRVFLRQYLAIGGLNGTGSIVRVAEDGSTPALPHVRFDTKNMWASGAIHNIDLQVTMSSNYLTTYRRWLSEPAWNDHMRHVPMDGTGSAIRTIRGVLRGMGNAGHNPSIGPITQPQGYLLSTYAPEAMAVVIGQAEAGLTWQVHYHDAQHGEWFNIYKRGGWLDGRGTVIPTRQWPDNSSWGVSTSHFGDMAFVPYLITARRRFLDHLTGVACFAIGHQWPQANGRRTPGVAFDVNAINSTQGRSAAWIMRTLQNAAWAAPDNHPSKAYLNTVVEVNWQWMAGAIPEIEATFNQGELHGAMRFANMVTGTGISMWQHDMFFGRLMMARRMDFAPEYTKIAAEWMSELIVGRFVNGHVGMNPHDATSDATRYRFAVGQPWVNTWKDMGQLQRDVGWSNGTGFARSSGYYFRYAYVSLGMLIDDPELRTPDVVRAFNWLVMSNAPSVQLGALANDPSLCASPEGYSRILTWHSNPADRFAPVPTGDGSPLLPPPFVIPVA